MKKLKEPLVEKTFDDLFSDFFAEEESLEMPINTAITISNSSSITNSTSTEIPNSIENTSSTTLQVEEQNQVELEKPSSFSELQKHFIQRMEKECKDKNLDELNEIQESLKDELDSFNEIKGYKNVYRWLIVPSMEKKKEKLITKEFEECITRV